ncbi:protein of unknown function [Methylocaldum szegediense]|uniref:Secreted protein n=1 Tax=Methylocaldum szegediense TaxID=73780 RepID=A0ABM9I240_9GAMM|nr:protein of unknown function [Methylocaldum szegediense]
MGASLLFSSLRLALRAVLRRFPFVFDERVHGKAARKVPDKDVRHEPHWPSLMCRLSAGEKNGWCTDRDSKRAPHQFLFDAKRRGNIDRSPALSSGPV